MTEFETAQRQFIETILRHHEAFQTGLTQDGLAMESANQISDEVVETWQKWRSGCPDFELRSISLLTHEHPAVRMKVATYSLPFASEKAEAALERLQDSPIPDIAFTSLITLQEWRDGNLNLDWLDSD